MSTREEPSYLAFARVAARNNESVSGTVARELVARIDRDASALKAAQPRTIDTVAGLRSLNDGAVLMSGGRIKMYDGAIWRVSDGMVVRVGKGRDGVIPFTYFIDPLPATVIHEPQP
jgi:hypothetical protein